jgi:hypothetical protein
MLKVKCDAILGLPFTGILHVLFMIKNLWVFSPPSCLETQYATDLSLLFVPLFSSNIFFKCLRVLEGEFFRSGLFFRTVWQHQVSEARGRGREEKAETQGSFGKFYISHYKMYSVRILLFWLKKSESWCGNEYLAVPPQLSRSGTVREVLTGEYDLFTH